MVAQKALLGGIELDITEVAPGFRVVSILAHPVRFADGELAPNGVAAQLVKASMPEVEIAQEGTARLVRAVPEVEAGSLQHLQKFAVEFPGVHIVSSILSVGAYRDALPGLVVSPITTPETSRLDNDKKVCYRDKWSC